MYSSYEPSRRLILNPRLKHRNDYSSCIATRSTDFVHLFIDFFFKSCEWTAVKVNKLIIDDAAKICMNSLILNFKYTVQWNVTSSDDLWKLNGKVKI